MYEPEEKIYVVKVNRNHEYFKHRSIQLGKFTDKGMKVAKIIPIPDDQFNCDLCNAKIDSLLINIILIKKAHVYIIHGAYCEKCNIKYHKEAITKDLQFFEKFLKKKYKFSGDKIE